MDNCLDIDYPDFNSSPSDVAYINTRLRKENAKFAVQKQGRDRVVAMEALQQEMQELVTNRRLIDLAVWYEENEYNIEDRQSYTVSYPNAHKYNENSTRVRFPIKAVFALIEVNPNHTDIINSVKARIAQRAL